MFDRPTFESPDALLADDARQRGGGAMAALSRFAFVLVAAAICAVIVATSLPEYRKLTELEGTLDEVKAMEAETLERMAQMKAERIGLQRDHEFLETRARDALDRALPGETIFRIKRAEN